MRERERESVHDLLEQNRRHFCCSIHNAQWQTLFSFSVLRLERKCQEVLERQRTRSLGIFFINLQNSCKFAFRGFGDAFHHGRVTERLTLVICLNKMAAMHSCCSRNNVEGQTLYFFLFEGWSEKSRVVFGNVEDQELGNFLSICTKYSYHMQSVDQEYIPLHHGRIHYPRMEFPIFFWGPQLVQSSAAGQVHIDLVALQLVRKIFELCALLLRAWYRQFGTTVQELHHIAECTMETNS